MQIELAAEDGIAADDPVDSQRSVQDAPIQSRLESEILRPAPVVRLQDGIVRSAQGRMNVMGRGDEKSPADHPVESADAQVRPEGGGDAQRELVERVLIDERE